MTNPQPPSPLPDPPSPKNGGVYFDSPYFHFSPLERRMSRFLLSSLFVFFALISIALLISAFPRAIFSPEYAFGFSYESISSLFSKEFSLGLLFLLFCWHETLELGRGPSSLRTVRLAKQPFAGNAARFLHPETTRALARIIESLKEHEASHLPYIALRTLIQNPRIGRLLAYLEMNGRIFFEELQSVEGVAEELEQKEVFVVGSSPFQQLLLSALEEALTLGHDYILPEDVFIAASRDTAPALKKFFLQLGLSTESVREVVYWMGVRRRRWQLRRKRTIAHRVMNRAWTARPTYLLDTYAQDLTDLAREGYAGFLIGHDAEVEAVIRILNRLTKNNILLIGEAGSGKSTILERIALLITENRVPEKLFDKRLAILDVGMLVAGAKNVGDLQARVVALVNEIIKAGNVILAIPDIHNLMKAGEGEGVSISTVLGPVFARSAFQVIGLTDQKNYRLFVESQANFKNHFETVKIAPLDAAGALRVLLVRARSIEELEDVEISYPALKKAVELADRYIHDRNFPGKALDLVTEGVELVKRRKGKKVLTAEDIATLISERTGVPVSAVTEEESVSLRNLEDDIHRRIVDQEEAVGALADVIRESRAGVRRKNAPVGSFLFVGPTGVGKTECAKALAEVYFKDEKAMVRFDMSEYQTRESIYRLIGSPDGKEGGQLTEQVKQRPYVLLLLDEFEKAHANVVDLFLQILDDGRATDATGTTVDFTNAVIIATSNAHSVFILESLKAGRAVQDIATELKDKLTAYFKPELLNRFDDIVVFKPLSPEDIRAVTRLQLSSLAAQLDKEKGIQFSATDRAVVRLVELGYNPAYGARPLRHVVRKRVRDLVADKILENEVVRGDSVVFDWNGSDFIITKLAG